MADFPGAAFDRWLTTDPREADAIAYEEWCERNERGGADDLDAYDDFIAEMDDRAEDAAEARAEAQREERMFDTGSDW